MSPAVSGELLWGSGELDLEGYLHRTGYRGPLTPDAKTLLQLHRSHVAAVPFENLDIILGRPVELEVAKLQAKLVSNRRGGYCYEHNLLFAAVLEQLGFSFTGLSARVTMGAKAFRPMTHMCLCVEAGGQRWLADVGFGAEGLLEPLPLQAPAPVPGARAFVLGFRTGRRVVNGHVSTIHRGTGQSVHLCGPPCVATARLARAPGLPGRCSQRPLGPTPGALPARR
ncbi:MAG TPA: arylamine N-acetyltransferase [Acidimicrobiales bacterium]|nr:arylamine N-acetyltransferase [Acidimicrobiales bacterium]